MRRSFYGGLALLLLATPVLGASFDCGKAVTNAERLVCSTPSLSKLDEDLRDKYEHALQRARPQDKGELARNQRVWIRQARDTCSDERCLTDAYNARLAELAQPAATSSPRLGDWVFQYGRERPLCQALLRRLDRFEGDHSREGNCEQSVTASFPEFHEPDWEEVDGEQSQDLAAKVLNEVDRNGHPDEPWAHERAREMLKEGWRVRVWRARFIDYLEDSSVPRSSPLPPGPQAIVQLYLPMSVDLSKSHCRGKPRPTHYNALSLSALFTSDLRHALQAGGGTQSMVASSDLKLYLGQPVFASFAQVYGVESGQVSNLCSFDFVERSGK